MSEDASADDLMIINAARLLTDDMACFVGIGLPSTAANLARRVHAPRCVLIYESGCIGAKPTRLPLSIGDGELAETADAVVSVPEIFSYWLQAGRIDVGFLGAAQLDRFGNINSTVIGPYDRPATRLPGAGGAPEIAASAGEVIVIMRQSRRAFVDRCDFVTSVGFGHGPGHRDRLGLRGRGPQVVITDLGILRPDPETCELILTELHPGRTVEEAVAATGWMLRVADDLGETVPPAAAELAALRALEGGVMDAFTYEALPGRVVFGAGAVATVGDEVAGLERSRVFLVSDGAAEAIADGVAARVHTTMAARWSEVVQHVPVDLADRARQAVTSSGADVVVCVGGGSSTGLAKAIALTHGLPVVAVPTTYAGSEMTPIYGLTGGRHKQTGRDLRVLPKVVIYDPELTLELPTGVTGPSAFNALAHCVEALYVPGANPVTSALALEGVGAIARSLPAVMRSPRDVGPRSDLLYGAYLAGSALGATGTGLHHKLCHVLGGAFDLVHADTHSVVLPHVVAAVAPARPDEMARLASALGVPGGDPAGALWDLAVASAVPTSLAQLGLHESQLAEAADRAAAEISDGPIPIDRGLLAGILERAYEGARP